MGKKRKTIGVLVGGVLNSFSENITRGVSKMCQELDYNMVVFPGKYINRDLSSNYDLMYEYQNNTCFEYPAACDIDGLIIAAGSIGSHSTEEGVLRFLEKYENIPFVLVASQFGDYVNISYDNYSGVKEGITYMIKECGCKKICMIGGKSTNTDAKERKEAFIETLNEYGMPYSEKQFVEGTLARTSFSACRKLLDRNPDVDGIFCVNDDTALALYDVMEERGLVPGYDIKVMGYDNTMESMKADPAIATVNADMNRLGQEALIHLDKMMKGEKVESLTLPASFLPRKSLGLNAESDDTDEERRTFNQIFISYIGIKSVVEVEYLYSIFSRMISYLKNTVNYSGTYSNNDFQDLINALLSTRALDFCDSELLLRYFEKIRIEAENRLSIKNINSLLRLYNMLYTRILRYQDKFQEEQKKGALEFSYEMKVFIMNTLRFAGANDMAYNKMVDYLKWLNINNAHIYIFEEEIIHLFGEKFYLPDDVMLKVRLRNGKTISIADSKQKHNTHSILREAVDGSDRGDFILLPLFAEEKQYGFMVCDLTEEMYRNSEFVASQMSSVAKIISVMRENARIQNQLEEHLYTLRENNIQLDTISKSDALTGIYNRRGFMEIGRNFLHDSESNVVVAYIDMNNLKIINDRYGHEQGDWSLMSIANLLHSTVGDNGIVARLGGDEFALMVAGTTSSDFKNDLNEAFDEFNSKSTKPYLVTVSVGTVTVNPSLDVKLESALSAADAELYTAKRNKINVVEKHSN